MRRRNASLIAACVLLVAVVPATALATHAGNQPEKFPAYYEGQVRQVMMGPAGNSRKRNQPPFACFGLGPDFSQTERAADVPLFYTLFIPGATQMGPCPPPTPPGFNNLLHDMVLSAVPGDRVTTPQSRSCAAWTGLTPARPRCPIQARPR